MIKINKVQAKKRFGMGQRVFMVACNMSLKSEWTNLCEMVSDEGYDEKAFNHIVNTFEYYNCDNQRGRYTSFYIKE